MQPQPIEPPPSIFASRQGLAFIAVLVLCGLEAAWLHPRLPARLATHFVGSGRPDGWMTAGGYTLFFVAMVLFIAATFAGSAVLIAKISPRWVNLPNRDYWLAPERQARTRYEIAASTLGFGAVTLGLLGLMHVYLYRINLGGEPRLGAGFWLGLAAYLVYTTVWTIALVLRYRKPRAAGQIR